MKRFVVPLAVASAMTVIGQVAVSQDASGINPEEAKYVLVSMPKGLVRAQANKVDKGWSPTYRSPQGECPRKDLHGNERPSWRHSYAGR